MYLIVDNINDFNQKCHLSDYIQLPVAERKAEFKEISGRIGSLTIEDEYQDVSFNAQLDLVDSEDIFMTISKINAWLLNSKIVTTSDWPFYFKIKHVAIADIKNDMGISASITVSFRCHPLKYLKDDKVQTYTNAGTIKNIGLTECYPRLKVFRNQTGIGKLTVGDTVISLDMQKEYIYIDSELMDAYYLDQNMNSFMTGDFPVLAVGDNQINFSGVISKVEIERRCCLI